MPRRPVLAGVLTASRAYADIWFEEALSVSLAARKHHQRYVLVN